MLPRTTILHITHPLPLHCATALHTAPAHMLMPIYTESLSAPHRSTAPTQTVSTTTTTTTTTTTVIQNSIHRCPLHTGTKTVLYK